MQHDQKMTAPSGREALIHEYLDGELDPKRGVEVEAMLDADPILAARFREYALQNRSLHELFDHHLNDELPSETYQLIGRLERGAMDSGRSRMLMRIGAIAAGVMVFVSLSLLTYQQALIRQSQNKLFTMFQETVAAEKPKAETAEVKQAAVTKGPAIAKAPSAEGRAKGTSPSAKRVPDLSRFGFRLVGTRVLLVSNKPAMQLLYQNEGGSQVTLYFSPTKSENQSLTLMQQGPLSLLYWSNSGRLYTMLGEVDRKILLEMGRVVDSNWTLVPNPAYSKDDTASPAKPDVVKPEVMEKEPGKPTSENKKPANHSRTMNIGPADKKIPVNGDRDSRSVRPRANKDRSV